MSAGNAFFEQLERHASFDDLSEGSAYEPLPDDWFVGMADIVGSTKLIDAGEYKKINTIGAAVIASQMNGADGQQFPFIFGGDGASFAFWPEHHETAEAALAAVRRWAIEEFGVELRGAIVPVKTIRDAGHDVKVARYSASEHADYAMFAGGGVAWAEAEMKAGRLSVDMAQKGTYPDLTGLSCRWTPMANKNGVMISLVISPMPDASPADIAKELHKIVELTDELEASGNPIHPAGPGFSWPPAGIEIEAQASHGTKSVFRRKIELFFDTLIALFFLKTGMKAGAFDPKHYLDVTVQNADFRKFDDGLKLTVDCSHEIAQRLRAQLEDAKSRGIIEYGLVEQRDALVTCIVPSVTSDDHIHFVDGASGGYAAAAAQMKKLRKPAKAATNVT